MRILFLSAWRPLPADNGSKLRILHLLRGLARQHEIDLLAFSPEPPGEDALRGLRTICASVELVPETPFAGRAVGRVAGLFAPQPRSIIANHSPAMAGAVRRRAGERYDLVIASQLHMAPYAHLGPDAPVILEEIELAMLHEQFRAQRRLRGRLRYGLTWLKTSRYVASLLRRCAGATVVSARELALLYPLSSPSVRLAVVPNGVDLASCAGEFGPPEPDTLIYPGALSYDANRDAVAYFVSAILPRVRAARPGVRFRVTGRVTPDHAAALAAPGVEFTGYLLDIRPAVAGAWAEVVPLRQGGGTRLKVLEALALGTPVVSTGKGVEGLELEPERDVLVADTPEAFARQTVRLLGSPELRAQLAANGRRAAERYDWQGSVQALDDLIEDVCAGASARPAVSARRRPAET